MRRVFVLLITAVLTCSSGWTAPPVSAIPAAPAKKSAGVAPPDIRRAIPAADVIIDAGHGGIDGGTHWGDIKESNINLAISRKLYLLLRSRGIHAVLNRTGDYALSDDNRWHLSRSRHRRDLSQRRGLSDELEAGLLVSIHVNWSTRSSKSGPLVLFRKDDASGALLAGFLQDSLNRQQGTRYLPKAAGRFYLLNTAKIPSAIVETGFLSHEGDRAMLTSPRGQTRIAEAIAAGIAAYRCLAP
ncbi:N-acetylmuramoyl-L-alanine amidase [Cohnella sp. CFH 77786]|uniref:N-acetylmuramoyl-L-alanine amidase n=1 Tax=Cohnella sp. CFH 77786 TaxID=2662265 RepID=UPI001C60EA93|nr:N-acetylmuramoyl-L-alanine amidase [Cohnella sp. CFH 77786]MBW5445142.1 N-acetylmuramoyl-L-alanine amidase [Cohnella sp. CFH 77786]